MACIDHTFPEERTPEGQLLLGPCLSCGLSALDAISELVRERDGLVRERRWCRNNLQRLTKACDEKNKSIAELTQKVMEKQDATKTWSDNYHVLKELSRAKIVELTCGWDDAKKHIADLTEQLETRQGLNEELKAQLYSTRNTLFARATDVQNLQALVKELERERDAALAETKRLREWLAQRTAIVGTMFACEAVVSDTCIANHGSGGAALEACQRLRASFALFLAGPGYQGGRRYHFALVVELPKDGG